MCEPRRHKSFANHAKANRRRLELVVIAAFNFGFRDLHDIFKQFPPCLGIESVSWAYAI
jgi:hypothetical protein